MNVRIDKDVFEKFHAEFLVGAIFCSNTDNSRHEPDIHEMLRDMEEFVRVNFSHERAQNNLLVSAWKAASEHFGDQFKHYHTNAERLMMTVLDGGEIQSKDNLTDLCNFISLKHIVPIGAFDARKISGDLAFTIAQGNELFGKKPVEAGELLLCDAEAVRARKLQYDIDQKPGVGNATHAALVLVEALPPLHSAQLLNIVAELAGLIKIFCGGKIQKGMLGKEQPEIRFS
ncbi:hypothetical protein HY497_02285 [Candidatus Woesearchaeota archaeon]|nr:hypothetical protein [Candidatus Woesearchaeota archaeon]